MRKETVVKISVLCLMIVMLFPTYVSANENTSGGNSTPLTVTVPEQPKEEMIVTTDGKTLKDVELPKGWVWEAPDTRLIPGDYMEGVAVYKDGNVITKRKIRVGQKAEIIDDKTDITYVIGKDTTLTVTSTGVLPAFLKAEMDGEEIPTVYYTRVSGSTILTFKQSYMDTLSVGKHTITLTYPVGSTSTTIEISKAQETVVSPTGTDSNTLDINTGDETSQAVWIILIVVSGIVLTGAYVKRRKECK